MAAEPSVPSPASPALAVRRGAWAWPFALALVFVAAIAAWSQWTMVNDLDDARRTLLADALTVESRLSSTLAAEYREIRQVAGALQGHPGDEALLRQPRVVEGLRRLWISVTVLDAGNRVLAHVPVQAARPEPLVPGGGVDEGGISAHLVQPDNQGGRLIVRIALATLLRQAVPWWLAQRYDARLVDGAGQPISGPVQSPPSRWRQSHRVSLEPALVDTYLELTTRDAHLPWWRTLLPVLMLLFLALSALATAVLRRRILQVEAAEGRWRTEAAWRRAIEDSLTVGLRGRDMEGRIVHVNRAFCDMVGLPAHELLGRAPPMPYWPHDQIESTMQRYRRTMAGGAPREGYEAKWIARDGRKLDVMIFEAPLVDGRGQQTGWMGSIVDVTARRQAEERERKQAQVLATQARLTTLGEVASALAHQLNQPLTAIAGYAGGALRALRRDGYRDEQVLDAVRRLAEQAAEAGRIVQRIRGFLTRRSPQREACAAADVLARVQALLARDLQRAGVALELNSPALPPVLADPVLVEQVLVNLARNALDAMLEARVPQPRLRLGASCHGERFVRVDVEDNGPGLQGRTIQQLSEPFYSTKPDGMGMGLAICRSVVEAHYGAMEAGASTLGGAMLSFTLPLADAAADAGAGAAHTPSEAAR